jgi:predicted 3-demethylubiquinone-9 3-methyltransferase (glyoxalase superfamily)
MQTITPFLWFEDKAEEAVNFYISVFKNGKVLAQTPAEGKPLTISFEVNGQRLIALNGGPYHKFNEAFSLVVGCDTQAEIDELWEKLSEGGSKGRCGWLKDKYGLWWQVTPKDLAKWISDPRKLKAVLDAIMKMDKLVIEDMHKAYEGKAEVA